MSALTDDPFDDPAPEQEHVGFVVRDMATADWALRKIARSQAKVDEVAAYVEWERQQLDRILSEAKDRHASTVGFFGPLLEEWHRKRLEEDPKEKTIRLRSGELVARRSPDTVRVLDSDGFVCAHGFDSPLVNVKAVPNLSAVKAAVLKDGESLPGVEVVPGEVVFKAKPGEIPPASVEGGF